MSHPMPHDLLALHTTDRIGSVAIGVGSRCVWRDFEAQGRHAPSLWVAVRAVLREAGVGLDALRGLVTTTGPGSFTGIRIGLATAQGLASARDWPLLVCDSLLALAAAHGPGPGGRAVVQDAGRGEVYAALYDVRDPVPRCLVAPFCAAPDEAAARLVSGFGRLADAPSSLSLALVGHGAALVQARLRELLGRPLESRPESALAVGRALIDLARAGGCAGVAPQDLEPIYLRESDAELRRQQPGAAGT